MVLETKLEPHLKALSDVERTSLNKLGDKTQVFVEKAYGYASTKFSSQLNGIVNIGEFATDYQAFKFLGSLNMSISQIARKLEDSTIISGSEALEAANLTYAGLSICIRNSVPGAQEAHNDLGVRYKKNKPANHIKPA